METLNIEKVMDEIREEARALRYSEAVPFEDIDIPAGAGASGCVDYREDWTDELTGKLQEKWEILYDRMEPGNPVKRFLFKCVRKLIRPVVQPMAIDETAFNEAAAQTIGQIRAWMREKDAENEALKARIRQLEKKAAETEK